MPTDAAVVLFLRLLAQLLYSGGRWAVLGNEPGLMAINCDGGYWAEGWTPKDDAHAWTAVADRSQACSVLWCTVPQWAYFHSWCHDLRYHHYSITDMAWSSFF